MLLVSYFRIEREITGITIPEGTRVLGVIWNPTYRAVNLQALVPTDTPSVTRRFIAVPGGTPFSATVEEAVYLGEVDGGNSGHYFVFEIAAAPEPTVSGISLADIHSAVWDTPRKPRQALMKAKDDDKVEDRRAALMRKLDALRKRAREAGLILTPFDEIAEEVAKMRGRGDT